MPEGGEGPVPCFEADIGETRLIFSGSHASLLGAGAEGLIDHLSKYF